ncbi:hypothetical protein EAG_04915 [Camponotus floridanus]|uniref:Uncharacterized protein n=1 Tax=Camponotus floridanus TaxID=104421 RepID=E2ARA4_CAMFO|nr:hypothetical protein EAG_04915 [Camponotus floridanus]
MASMKKSRQGSVQHLRVKSTTEYGKHEEITSGFFSSCAITPITSFALMLTPIDPSSSGQAVSDVIIAANRADARSSGGTS